MPEDTPSTTSMPTSSRPKAPKSSQTAGVVRGRSSPAPGSATDPTSAEARPQKRARKAINCEPCRNSKLKCDRNRPCSSCVLRGTSAMCYQDGRPEGDSYVRGDDHHYTRIDPAAEIARLRHSITMLESYVFPNLRPQNHAPPTSTHTHRRASEVNLVPKKEPVDPDVGDKPSASGTTTAPGMLGSKVQGGLYAGPTSTALHLLANEGSRGTDDDSSSRQPSQELSSNPLPESLEDSPNDFPSHEYDRDLLSLLPTIEIIDGLIAYYFEYCNWIYRHVNQAAFTQNWEKYKNGLNSDRVILSTACVIMAIATQYLPSQHSLLESFTDTHDQLGQRFFDVSTQALHRKQQEARSYTLDLVELLLIRTHHLNFHKSDSEETWHIRGELVTIGTAMGLHRDPGKWRMHRDVAERRRWAWWHIILLERWQAFMFGRPLAIASHHFDTQLPSYCDPAVDKSGRLYLPNIALFRLAFILGDIMDDAVSVRTVPYESVMANDRALTQWMDNIPPELDLDEYRVARNLASPNVNLRRLGVQSVIIRTSYYHIRFTLHRPYASAGLGPAASSSSTSSSNKNPPDNKHSQSLEIAVTAASELITMVGQSRPDFLANSSLAVPGHMNWGPFHCFSAAMFFSFQLIANADQPGSSLFRASIKKAMHTLENCRGIPLAEKAFEILFALAPLYSVEFHLQSKEHRDKERARILNVVRNLAFPYHDSHDPRRFIDNSPGSNGSGRYMANGSPMNSSSVSPPLTVIPSSQTGGQDSNLHGHARYESSMQTHQMSSIRTSSVYNAGQMQTSAQQHPSSPLSQAPMSPAVMAPHSQSLASLPASASPNSYPSAYVSPQQQQMYNDSSRYSHSHYGNHMDDTAMWGAAVGFGQGEWSQFLDGFRPSAPSGSVVAHQRHLQG